MKIDRALEYPPAEERTPPRLPGTYHSTFVLQVIEQSVSYTDCEPAIRRLLRASYGAASQGSHRKS